MHLEHLELHAFGLPELVVGIADGVRGWVVVCSQDGQPNVPVRANRGATIPGRLRMRDLDRDRVWPARLGRIDSGMASRGHVDVSPCKGQPDRANERRRVLEQRDALDEFKSHALPRPDEPMDSFTVPDSRKSFGSPPLGLDWTVGR